MAVGRACRRDTGSALLEVIVVGIALLIPLGYIGLAAASVQSAAFAATQAVREAARAFVTAPTPDEGRTRARIAVALAMADQGLRAPANALRITCDGGACLAPGSAVVVDLAWQLPLPWIPGADSDGPSLGIEARHRLPIDDYRGDPA